MGVTLKTQEYAVRERLTEHVGRARAIHERANKLRLSIHFMELTEEAVSPDACSSLAFSRAAISSIVRNCHTCAARTFANRLACSMALPLTDAGSLVLLRMHRHSSAALKNSLVG